MNTSLLDIFPKKKKKEKKYEIIIDYREKNSLLPSELVKKNFEIIFKELKVADYIIKGIAIERKTVSDFINSMINRRLTKQLEELSQYKKRILMIEGLEEQELYNDENSEKFSNSIRGFILSIILKYETPIIFTKDYKDSAKYIELLARKKETESPLQVKKKTLNKKEQMQYIIEGFPGIGPKNAKKLLNEFKTIKEIINANEEDLKQIIGKKAEILKRIINEKY